MSCETGALCDHRTPMGAVEKRSGVWQRQNGGTVRPLQVEAFEARARRLVREGGGQARGAKQLRARRHREAERADTGYGHAGPEGWGRGGLG